MNPDWQTEFRQRMAVFRSNSNDSNKFAISIKIRVTSGCFHREHSPRAYELIDRYQRSEQITDAVIEEHESGPEVLAWVVLTTSGISLAAAVINLVAAIIKARSQGITKGDHPSDPLELIVRGHSTKGAFFEETLLRIPSGHPVDAKEVEKVLLKVISGRVAEKPAKAKRKQEKKLKR
jgi:hypothetical protein